MSLVLPQCLVPLHWVSTTLLNCTIFDATVAPVFSPNGTSARYGNPCLDVTVRAAFMPDSTLEFLPIFSSLKCTKSSIFSGFLHS